METILIVDDEKNYLVILEALLATEGYEIITDDNAAHALRLIQETDLHSRDRDRQSELSSGQQQ